MNINVWVVAEPIAALVAAKRPVDPARLADSDIDIDIDLASLVD